MICKTYIWRAVLTCSLLPPLFTWDKIWAADVINLWFDWLLPSSLTCIKRGKREHVKICHIRNYYGAKLWMLINRVRVWRPEPSSEAINPKGCLTLWDSNVPNNAIHARRLRKRPFASERSNERSLPSRCRILTKDGPTHVYDSAHMCAYTVRPSLLFLP